MLLHRLEVTAFGPFAGTERVNFDELGDSGLFLLTGSTGAGKTSLLDAVCFALFGSVPGPRDQAGRLRSDHAADGVVPRVALELTVAGRRLRVVRTPTWFAPRRRGTGDAIKQQPTAALSQWRNDEWEPLSSRIPEVADQIQTLLGMDVHQFTQVAMLPQGAFAQFLRAGADERKKVLERLFGTQRFRAVERWLVDHRRDCKMRNESALQELRRSVDRVLGAAGDLELADTARTDQAGADVHADEDPDRPTTLQLPADPAGWPRAVAALRTALSERHAAALARQRRAAAEAAATAATVEDARGLVALQTRVATAQALLTELETGEEQAQADADRLHAAERAATVAAHVERLDAAEGRVRATLTDFEAALRRARRLDLDVPEPHDSRRVQLAFAEHVCRTGQKLVDGGAQLRQLHTEHVAATKAVAKLGSELDTATAALDQAQRRVDAGPAARRLLELREAAARSTAAQEPHCKAELERVRIVHAAAAALPEAVAGRHAATTERDAAFAALNKAQAHLNEIVAARLESAAAWLASRLQSGDPCQVCGSVEHPEPHPKAADAPSEHDERRARTVAQRAQKAKESADERLTAAREQVARLESASENRALADLAADRAAADRRLTAARAAVQELPNLEALRAELDAQLGRDRAGLDASARRVDVLTERISALRAHDDDRVAQLIETVGSDLDVDGYIARVQRRDEAAQVVVASLRGLVGAEDEQVTASKAAMRALRAAGFESLADVRGAALDPAAMAALRATAQQRRDRRRRALDELAEPAVARAAQLDPPDLAALETGLAGATADAADAARCASVLGARLTDLTRLSVEVETACAAWLPLRQQSAVAEAMASLAEGQSADNVQRVSLSAYVLAARLQQVVDAANERLVPMTSGRYTLEHTMDRNAGDRRGAGGGLGLLVCDQWTGDARDPKTLSGGETFQASLALALGLSDVVTHEVGGVEMRTLFVDEGFGSLDADSLDEVMDVLDGLRAGGRRVGVVSHVDTMRERIPSQVRLVKSPTGSRVEHVTS